MNWLGNIEVNKTFSKIYRDVGMAVPKTTARRYRDRAYKHCTNIPIPTYPFCT